MNNEKTPLDDELREEYDETVLKNGVRGKFVARLKAVSDSKDMYSKRLIYGEVIKMTFSDLVPVVKDLSRSDKIRLMQIIVGDLAKEEGVATLEPHAEYPVWTPLNAFEA